MIGSFDASLDGQRIGCDIAIVGGGVAGITLARALIGGGLDVCLLEGGGWDISIDSQEIYEGEIVGTEYLPLDVTRLRYLGGTSNHWTGYCRRLDPIDFRARPWLSAPGWPIGRDDVDPYYEKAHDVLRLPNRIDGRRLWEHFGIRRLDFDPARLEGVAAQVTPRLRFGEVYGPQLASADNVRVILDANLTEIIVGDDASHVDALAIENFAGHRARIEPRVTVLAMGGIENARVLLASNRVQPQGVGNRHGLVGRYFADHTNVIVADIFSEDFQRLADGFGPQFQGAYKWYPYWLLDAQIQEREGLTNCYARLQPEVELAGGVTAMLDLYDRIRQGALPAASADLLWQAVKEIDDVALAAWNRFVLGRKYFGEVKRMGLMIGVEPAPNPASRVRLGESLDRFGMPQPVLDWRPSGVDFRSLKRLAEVVGTELARLKLGRMRLHGWLEREPGDDWCDSYLNSPERQSHAAVEHISFHHIGTTRMSELPQDGVVDRHCRVHGTDNLYIAGSSIFASAGNAQPTLTIVALALRLADRLQSELTDRPMPAAHVSL